MSIAVTAPPTDRVVCETFALWEMVRTVGFEPDQITIHGLRANGESLIVMTVERNGKAAHITIAPGDEAELTRVLAAIPWYNAAPPGWAKRNLDTSKCRAHAVFILSALAQAGVMPGATLRPDEVN